MNNNLRSVMLAAVAAMPLFARPAAAGVPFGSTNGDDEICAGSGGARLKTKDDEHACACDGASFDPYLMKCRDKKIVGGDMALESWTQAVTVEPPQNVMDFGEGGLVEKDVTVLECSYEAALPITLTGVRRGAENDSHEENYCIGKVSCLNPKAAAALAATTSEFISHAVKKGSCPAPDNLVVNHGRQRLLEEALKLREREVQAARSDTEPREVVRVAVDK